MTERDVVIIGGGPAGLAAAVAAKDAGCEDILILERDKEPGGILNQCIHNGFGLHTFKEELTGPEYAQRFIDRVKDRGIEIKLSTMVLEISSDKVITAMSRTDGVSLIKAKAIVLAMGCRERSRGALNIPGYRPAGIYSAGTAQRFVNIEGLMPGKEVVILGSGDIGLIMARRMTLEGAKVKVVAELMPYSGGLKRNIVQCLDDYGIPLKLSHTVVDIEGKERVTGVTIAEVGSDGKPIAGTEEHYKCDTLLLSCGLIPENELSRGMGVDMNPVTGGPRVDQSFETSIPGVFAAGNVLHVHDLVDFVSEEAGRAGAHAAAYALVCKGESEGSAARVQKSGGRPEGSAEAVQKSGDRPEGSDAAVNNKGIRGKGIQVTFEGGPRYTVPETIDPSAIGDGIILRFRVGSVIKNATVTLEVNGKEVMKKKRPVMAPGEMEELKLGPAVFEGIDRPDSICVKVVS